MTAGENEGRDHSFVFKGEVVSGVGQGSFYLSQPLYKDQINALFGFQPFPGTLNIRISKELFKDVRSHALKNGPVLNGSRKGVGDEEQFFRVFSLPCQIEAEKVVALFPERSVHDDELELISPEELRKKLALKDGDPVEIRVN